MPEYMREGKTVALADYLLARLKQLEIQSIHGVPGDYNLELLDHVEDNGFTWVGNCNELNAGYAADGYARIKGAAALITTFGVGELSAINAIAGAYAEFAPVVHIVGAPSRTSRKSRALIHHTLNDGEYGHFEKMVQSVTVYQAILDDPFTATALIDAALRALVEHCRPVYITLPVDMVKVSVLADPLDKRLSLWPQRAQVDAGRQAQALEHVLSIIKRSLKPLILIDGESRAFYGMHGINEMVIATPWPVWTSTFGKGLVNEEWPTTMGIWSGNFAPDDHKAYFASSDLILCLGPHLSGTNTYLYATAPDEGKTIFFDLHTVRTPDETFEGLDTSTLLQQIRMGLRKSGHFKTFEQSVKLPQKPTIRAIKLHPDQITQRAFYRQLNRFLRQGDLIFGETGTAGYGCRDLVLPKDCRMTLPVTWLSIGYMLPAAQGAALARRDYRTFHVNHKFPPRTILVIGDGSVQMTVQEISTMIRHKLNVTIIILNNNGYTIEKCIHGLNRAYNDVAAWNYLEAPRLFGASYDSNDDYYADTARATTPAEVEKFFKDEPQPMKPKLRMLEVMMDAKDAPKPLLGLLNAQKT